METQAKTSRHALGLFGALLVPIVLGLSASTVLLVDYLRPAPVFCSYDGGCDAVKRTVFAAFFDIPTPVFGVAIFSLFAALTLSRGRFARIALLGAAGIAACVGVFFISVQVRIATYCVYCMTADVASILVLAAATWRFREGWDPPESKKLRLSGAAAFAMALGIPGLVGVVKKPNLPDVIAREIAATPPGKVTVVDFVDFECPYCRETHQEILPVLDRKADHLRIVRKNVPLTRIHPHAMDAARAACCGELMGKGEAFANALMTMPVDDLTPAGCEKIALSLGLDVTAFKACVADPKTAARIQSDTDDFKSTHGHGLPTLWIGEERLEGAQDAPPVERAIDRAITRQSS